MLFGQKHRKKKKEKESLLDIEVRRKGWIHVDR